MPNIFTALFKPKPTADSVTFKQPFTFGKATSGVDVTERTALNTSAVYACVRVVSEAIASLPLRVYKDTRNGLERSPDHSLYDILHDAPNPDMTSFVFWEVLMSHLLLYGNCFAQIVRNGLHQVTGLYPLLPNKIEMNRDENGELFYTYQLDYNEPNPNHDRQTVILPKAEVLHIRGLSHDGLFGYSPVKINRNAIGMAVATENYGASFFANGANPSGVLQHTGKINSTEAIRESWEKLLKGRGSNRVAVLEDGMTYKPIGIPPEQAQFLETRKFQLSEIARIFRVPPHMIGDLERSTFSNIEQQAIEFTMHTVKPWVIRIEQALKLALLSPSERKKYVIKFNLDGMLRGDYATRMEGYKAGRQNGWLSINDIRRLEDMNPISAEQGGDRYLVNGNMVDANYKKENNSNE